MNHPEVPFEFTLNVDQKFQAPSTFLPDILPLVSDKDPVLHQKTEHFDFSNPPMDPIKLYNNLGRTLVNEGGLGLAAPQVGLPYRAFVLRSENIIGVFNPIVVDESEEQIILEEGCLSYKGLFVKVKRARRIRVRYATPDGDINTHVFHDMTARCFLHELDHLNGVVMHDRANKYHLELAKKKLIKATRNQRYA